MEARVTVAQRVVERFQILLGLLIALIFIRYVVGVGIPAIVFVAISAAIAATCSKDEVIAFYVCCIPMHEMLNLTTVLVVCSAIYVVRFSETIKLNLVAAGLVLLMMVWELLHYVGVGFSTVDFIVSFVPMVVLVLFVSTDASRLDYELVVRSFAATALCVCVILMSILLVEAEFDIREVFSHFQRLGEIVDESTGDNVALIHPNTLGIICVLASVGLMQLSIAGWGTRLDLATVMILLAFGTMTLSRTFLVCLAVAIVLLLLCVKGGVREKSKFAFLVAVIALIALLLLYLFVPELFDQFYKRFQQQDFTSGRLSTMADYHHYITSDASVAFFGVGMQDLHERLVLQDAVAMFVPHNGLQETVIVWGVPGLLMFCALLGLMVKQARDHNGCQSLINYIPLIILLAKIQAGQMVTSSYTILAFSFAYISLCCCFESRNAPESVERSV